MVIFIYKFSLFKDLFLGSAVAAKSIFTFNESSSKMPGFSPESAIPLLSNFTSIPLFKSEKDVSENSLKILLTTFYYFPIFIIF